MRLKIYYFEIKKIFFPGREPVLKGLVKSWLMQRAEVLAYCQARATEGGAGALIVLLKRQGRRP